MGMTTPTDRDVILRRAGRDDRLRIRHLFLTIHEEYGLAADFDVRDADIMQLPDSYAGPRNGFWLLEKQDDSGTHLIGTIALRQHTLREAELKRFYVHQAFRKGGYGRALMDLAVDAAKQMKFTRLILESHTCQQPAIHFYSRYGFHQIPVYSNEPPDYSDIAFALELLSRDET